MDIYTIISTLVIPVIVMLLKKVKLPAKYAPLAAFAVAIILVGVGQFFKLTLDIPTVADAILKGLATAGVAVLGYDTVKKLSTDAK